METPEPGRVTLTHRAGVTGVRCGVRPGSVLGGGHHRRSLGGGDTTEVPAGCSPAPSELAVTANP